MNRNIRRRFNFNRNFKNLAYSLTNTWIILFSINAQCEDANTYSNTPYSEIYLFNISPAPNRNVRCSTGELGKIQLKIYPSHLIHSRTDYRLYVEFQRRIARNLSNSTRARRY